ESAQELIDKVGILVGKGMLKKGYMWLGDEKWADDLQDVKNAEMREEITRQVQTKLGLPADGKAGEQTIVAILKLERGNAKEPTGQFSQWLLEKLEVDSGVHKAEPGKQTLSRKSGRK
ncbi:MAG: hypothetical protein JNG86_20490, partial [Verrucomicrobiaceae bacterium]|nr:hypothetical protein [Verrucomicrobiaceae bacterium]